MNVDINSSGKQSFNTHNWNTDGIKSLFRHNLQQLEILDEHINRYDQQVSIVNMRLR